MVATLQLNDVGVQYGSRPVLSGITTPVLRGGEVTAVLPAARSFPELGAVGTDKQLPAPRDLSGSVRSVQARELNEDDAVPSQSDGQSLTARAEQGAFSGEIGPEELSDSGAGMEAARSERAL